MDVPDQNQEPRYGQESGMSLFLKLFLVPALIVLAALGLFLLTTWALKQTHTPGEYLQNLRSDSTNRRWQAAFELSKVLLKGDEMEINSDFRAQLVRAYAEGGKDDPRLRSYLALVLGRLKEKSAVPALREGLSGSEADVRLYSAWALGNIGDASAGPDLIKVLEDPDPGVGRMALGALSALKYVGAKDAFIARLSSSERVTQYDAAVGLARLGDKRAEPMLLEMLSLSDPKDSLASSAKIAALDGFRVLRTPALLQKVGAISKSDADLKVREAALSALQTP